jgi:predicted glycogen debranching enzyme
MPYIQFTKKFFAQPEQAIAREYLETNPNGAYCNSTLINCNSRKYHGLLVVKQPQIDDGRYVLLSALDETIFQGAERFSCGTHKYPNAFHPEGFRLYNDFSNAQIPTWTFKTEGFTLRKELLLVEDEDRLLVRYTVVEAKPSIRLQLDPFVAFRNIHTVYRANTSANWKTEQIANGIKLKLYAGFSDLHIQFSKAADFIPAPDWYYNIEYDRERERGYAYQEDLYHPGYFEIAAKKGDQIIFSAGVEEITPRKLKTLFEKELKKRPVLKTYDDCLQRASAQFIVNNHNRCEIMAGYPWFGAWGRDTFIALPGLTLATGKHDICKEVLNTMVKDLKYGLFPNVGNGVNASYNGADASLWFFWTLQQYREYTRASISSIWKKYGAAMKFILEYFRQGTLYNIHMQDDGLLYAGETGSAITWMDAIVDGKGVTPRIGATVELNALWYNAICFGLEGAAKAGDSLFIESWGVWPDRIVESFISTFWSKEKGYLADCANGGNKDWALRPNQIFATSLPFSPLPDKIKGAVLETVKEKLLTPRGLRTLSADDPSYKGIYQGDQRTRDMAYHQGTVWPWLTGHFVEAYYKVHGAESIPFLQSIYDNFSQAVDEYGIGSIAEIYDGDAPHAPRGAISQAWSVAELLRIETLIKGYVKE